MNSDNREMVDGPQIGCPPGPMFFIILVREDPPVKHSGDCNIPSWRMWQNGTGVISPAIRLFDHDGPAPLNIGAARIPSRDPDPRAVRPRICIRPIACSLPLFVRGAPFSPAKTR